MRNGAILVLLAALAVLLWWWLQVPPGTEDALTPADDSGAAGPDLLGRPIEVREAPEPAAVSPEADGPDADDDVPVEPETPPTAVQQRRGWHQKVPPGLIEGVLFDRHEPLTDAEAYVWDATGAGTPAGIPSGKPPLTSVLVDRDGRYRFDGLEPGSYFVGVKVPGESARLAFRKLKVGEQETDRAIIVLGTATVTGIVYDDDGAPAPEALVRLSLTSVGGPWDTISDTTTDASGRYRFSRLLEGGGWLTVAYTGDFDDGDHTRSRRFGVKRGQTLEEDFGAPQRVAVVAGTLRARTGEPLRGPGRLILSRQGSGEYLDAAYDADGRYSHRMPAGTYDVDVWYADRNRWPHAASLKGALVVADQDLERDLTIPGARLRGRVTGGPPASARVRWSDGKHSATVAVVDGAYVIDGLPPGEYELTAAEATERVTLTANDTEVVRDIPWTTSDR